MPGPLHAAAVAAVVVALSSAPATAQSAVQPVVNEMNLTEKHIHGFIAAQKEMSAVLGKIQGATADQLPAPLQAELEAVARKHGFKDFNEYDEVVDNISTVMAGIDPATRRFTEPSVSIRKEIEAITVDKSIPEDEKKQLLEELNEALKSARPMQYPGNIELVRKYYDSINASLD